MVEWILFGVLAATAIIAAVLVILPPMARNPLHAAVALIVSLSAIGGLFLLQAAHLVAVLQILVYVGAVVMLFLFVIMLVNLGPEELGSPRIRGAKAISAVIAVGGSLALAWALWRDPPLAAIATPGPEFGWVSGVSRALFADQLVPFELMSIFLLIAIVGALVLAKREL